MNKTILQVPVSKTLRNQAASAAQDLGLSSLQEAVRLFLNKLAQQEITISFTPKPIKLSPQAIKRYNKITTDIASGKQPLYATKNKKDLLSQLYGRKRPVHSKIS